MPRRVQPPPPFPAESVPLSSAARIPTDPTKHPGVSFRVRTGVGRPQTDEAGHDKGDGRPQGPVRGTKGAGADGPAQAPVSATTGRGEGGDQPRKRGVTPAASAGEPPLSPASRTRRALSALRHGRHRRGRGRAVLLLGLAAALGVAVLSLVRVAPDSGPGTAEAEPRHPAGLTAEPSAGVSATVVAAPPVSKAVVPVPTSALPTPANAGSDPGSPPAAANSTPTARPPGETPRAVVPQTSATPEVPATTPPAPPPAPTRPTTPTPTASASAPAPDGKGLCVPVLGLCLGLR